MSLYRRRRRRRRCCCSNFSSDFIAFFVGRKRKERTRGSSLPSRPGRGPLDNRAPRSCACRPPSPPTTTVRVHQPPYPFSAGAVWDTRGRPFTTMMSLYRTIRGTNGTQKRVRDRRRVSFESYKNFRITHVTVFPGFDFENDMLL